LLRVCCSFLALSCGGRVVEITAEDATDGTSRDADADAAADAAGPAKETFRIVSVDVEDHITYRLANPDAPALTGDLWPATWGDDGHLYTACGDGFGFGFTPSDVVFNVVSGNPPDMSGRTPENAWGVNIAGVWSEDLTLNRKPTGLTCVDGVIYLFFQNLRNMNGEDPFGDAPAASVSLTRDRGRTWEYDAEKPMFGDHVFTTGFFLDFGRCQEHRIDEFEYVYGLDYNWRFSDDFLQTKMFLARVPRGSIVERDRWEFFSGFKEGRPVWSGEIGARSPVVEDDELYCGGQSAIAQGHVVFIPRLSRYLYSSRAVCVWIFYEAPEPWGPWTKVSVKEWKGKWTEEYHAGYNVVIPSKFLDEDGRGGWTITSLSSNTFDGAYYNMGFRRFRLEAEPVR
jgi:hypothetical protein